MTKIHSKIEIYCLYISNEHILIMNKNRSDMLTQLKYTTCNTIRVFCAVKLLHNADDRNNRILNQL